MRRDLRGNPLVRRAELLAATDWLSIRHGEQQAAGIQTSLTTGQFAELLAYRQALRDVSSGGVLPVRPVWLD